MEVWRNDGQVPPNRKDPIALEIAQLLSSESIEYDRPKVESETPRNNHRVHQSSVSSASEQIHSSSKSLEQTPTVQNAIDHSNTEREQPTTPLHSLNRKKSMLIDLPPPYPSTMCTNRGSVYNSLPSYKLDRFADPNASNKMDQAQQCSTSVRPMREQNTGSIDSEANNFRLPLPAIVDQPSFLSSTSSFNSSSQSSLSNSPLFIGLPSKFTFSNAPTKLRPSNCPIKVPVTMRKSSSLPSPPPPDIDTASKLLMSIKDGQKRASIPELLN